MGQITSLFVHKVLGQVQGPADTRALAATVGVDLDAPVDPAKMVPAHDYYALFEAAARADENGVGLPLRTGASMRCADYGAFGLAWKAAQTLADSCQRAVRYARVLTSVSTYTLERHEDGTGVFELHREGERNLGMRLSNEATLASVVSIAREVAATPFTPLAVEIRHPAPGAADLHQQHFGCPVTFDAGRDAIHLSRRALSEPNRQGDESFVRFFDQALEQAVEALYDPPALDVAVSREISQALSGGVPRITTIAGSLGMSGRTLQRRLAAEGRSFQSLVEEARHRLAERLLGSTSYPIADVSFLTGFSEQSAFNRAFRRWTGQTPGHFRQSAQR